MVQLSLFIFNFSLGKQGHILQYLGLTPGLGRAYMVPRIKPRLVIYKTYARLTVPVTVYEGRMNVSASTVKIERV